MADYRRRQEELREKDRDINGDHAERERLGRETAVGGKEQRERWQFTN